MVFNRDKSVYNIFAVNFLSLFMIIVTGYTNPMINSFSNTTELLNEAFILVFTYHLYQFTDYMPDLYARNLVGNSLVVLTIINTVLNLGVS